MRSTLRTLSGQPGLAALVVATLAVALAFLIAAVGAINGLLFHPYAYPRLRQLVLVRDATPVEGAHQGRSIAVGDFLDVRAGAPAFASVAGWRPQPIVITSAAADPERLEAAAVTANFFATLGIRPVLGQVFAQDAGIAGHDRVVVLSRRLWNSRFGADPSIVGRDVGIDGRAVTVAGIIRDEDCYPSGVDAWIPWVFAPSEVTERGARRVAAIGRLSDPSTIAEAAGQLASLSQTLASRYPLTNRGRGFDLLPLRREQYEFTAPLFLFVLAAALLVLALAVINVSNLLVARTLDRRRELAVRTMLGASRLQVAAGPVSEAAVLAAAAMAAGALAAPLALGSIRASLPEGIARWIAGWSSLRIDSTALTVGVAIGAIAALGIAGCVVAASLRAADDGGGGRTTRRSTWSRRILVGGEVGLAAALLLGASVMVAGFTRISAAYEQLAPDRVLKFTLTLPEARYGDARRIASFHAALLDRLRGLAAVEQASLVRNEPASNVPNPIVAFDRGGDRARRSADRPRADVEVVSPAAFAMLHLDVLSGRALSGDDGADAARVAVVSRTAARRFWPDRTPVGATMTMGDDQQPVRIVGVVSDLTLNWYDPATRPVIFLPDAQSPARTTSVLVRTRTDPLSVAGAVRAAVTALDARQPVSSLEPFSTTIADSLAPIRIIERLLLVGAALAAGLAALGIYGVLAHWVRARRRELGVRFAVGATRSMIGRMVLREALTTAGGGVVCGLGAAIALVRLAGGSLLGVPALDARAALVVCACAIAVTLVGAVGPARRAARVDVAELLRLE
jgi:putative ABC transport system permease protein